MKITLNNNEIITSTENLYIFLKEKDLINFNTVVILNNKILKNSNIKNISLSENDEIEILNFVGGG